jgi:hypothetical protein
MYPLAQTVGHVRYHSETEDDHGNPVARYHPERTRMVYGYGPRTVSTEPGGTQVIEGLDMFAPLFAVDHRDRFVVDGRTHVVEGDVSDWTHGPFGFKPGQVIHLKRVEGGT